MSKPTTIEIGIWTDPVWGPGHSGDILDELVPDSFDGLGVSTYRYEIRLIAVEVFTEYDEADGGGPGDVETLEWRSATG